MSPAADPSASQTGTVLGVDGWKGAWVGAYVRAGQVSWGSGRFADLLRPEVEVVGVDIPVGLAARGRRGCDVAAKVALGPAASRVFWMPPAYAFEAATHAEANVLLRAAGEPAISFQAWALRAAVREVGAHASDPRVVEVHPELSFLHLAGGVLPSKKTAAGVGARIEALSGWVDLALALRSVPPRVPVDDALDALAAAWSAARVADGTATAYPADGALLSELGRPMQIYA
jgi:predicted RNase H-like nuclease